MFTPSVPIHEIDAYIHKALQDWGVPGAAVAILKDDKLLLSKGYGVKEIGQDDPVDENTLFAIGSCTKAFTAAAIGMLVDEGKVGWDDKIVTHLPDFELYDPWITKEVTIRDMLTHRVGIMRTQRLMFKEKVFDPDDNIRRMRYMRPVAPFRTKCHYNNPGFILAGKIVEIVSGQTWEEFMDERFFKPLGMTSSSPTLAEHRKKGFTNAASFHLLPELRTGFIPSILRMFEPVQPSPWTDFGKNTAGTIISNLPDCLAWLKMLLNNGAYQGKQLLSPQAVKELTRAQIIVKPEEDEDVGPIFSMAGSVDVLAYGLGWYVCIYKGRLLVVHGGDAVGHSSVLMFMPQENLAMAIFVNTLTWVHAFLGFYITDALLDTPRDFCAEAMQIMTGAQQQAQAGIQQMVDARDRESSPTLPLEEYAGTYSSDLFGEIEITFQDGQLVHRYGGGDFFVAELEHWEGDTFVANYHNRTYDPEFITFAVGDDKKVRALEVKSLELFVDTFRRIS